MQRFFVSIAVLAATIGCTPTPAPPQAIDTPSSRVNSETLRGAVVVVEHATYGGYADNALSDALSYFDQGDRVALDRLLSGDYPDAIAVDAETRLKFEGCYYGPDNCELVWLREEGSTDKWVFDGKALAVDR